MGKWYILLISMGIGSVNGFTIPAWAWIVVGICAGLGTAITTMEKLIERGDR